MERQSNERIEQGKACRAAYMRKYNAEHRKEKAKANMLYWMRRAEREAAQNGGNANE